MATVRIQKNILEEKIDTYSINEGVTIETLIRERTDGDTYDSTLVECYDAETGKTFFAPIEEDIETLHAIVQVNGKDESLDYVVKANDIITIIITPAGGSFQIGWDWLGALGSAIEGALIGFAYGNGVGALVGGIIGFFAGGLITGTMIESMKADASNVKSESGLNSEKLPDVRGASNQPLLDQAYPTVIGRHLVAPFIIGSPWNEISGTHGEENYIHILYAVGFAPLRLTDFKLGEMFLAHNQRWSDNRDMKNVFHGLLTGIDNGNNSKGIEYYQSNTTVDLYHRPLVDAETMRAAGWDVEDGEIATVYSCAYSNQSETKTVLVTPIVSAQQILTPSQTEEYANRILNEQGSPANILLGTFEGEDSIIQADLYAEGLHNSQATYYGINGDIVNTWINNDVSLEILQQGQNGESVDYGSVYPFAKIQRDINSNVLYIADGTLEEIDQAKQISYKGLGLKNGLRNNPIRFTEQYPKSATVELNFASGLYKSRSETSNDTSTVKYYKIPMWVAIQWRVYSEANTDYTGNDSGESFIPSFNYQTESYDTPVRGWHSFNTINGTINSSIFTLADRNNDIDAHTGNKLKNDGVYTDINTGWIDSRIFNLQSLGGTNEDTDGINEFRCVTSVDFVQWARDNLLLEGEDDTMLAKKFKAYFMDASNTSKSVEIRVVRISPCYIDETTSSQDHSAFKFSDIFTWKSLTSEMIDGDALIQKNQIVQTRPLTEDRMRKLCVVSLKAKTDSVDQLSNTIKKFSCIAQSFAPYYDQEEKKWLPESVHKITKYYKPAVRVSEKVWMPGEEITEQQFYEDRQNGIKSIRTPGGNDFVPQMVNNIIRTDSHVDLNGRYIIPYDDKEGVQYKPDCDGTLNYCTNGVASMFLLAGISPMLGIDALGYEQDYYDQSGHKSDIGDFNLTALAKWNNELIHVRDGSYYPSNGYHYNERGERVEHLAGEEVVMFFTANAYIYNTDLLENIFAKIAIAGRAVYTRDRKGRLTVIMDKPEKYPVALINQQNTIKSSYTISFAELPSGLQIVFPDENDGYEQNNFYCMVDGEDYDKPRGAIEQYRFDFVTNGYQQNSLGRYLLANRILNKEVVTKQLGIEGYSIGLGNLVLVSDDTMLIGTDNGARITKLIEDDNSIYGFIVNNTYKYTGEEEEYTDGNNQTQTRCKQGVVVMQPGQFNESRIITLRLAKVNTTITVGGTSYTTKKGQTNTVIFDTAISKSQTPQSGSIYYIYKPKVDNVVSFGIVGQITSTYRVIKVKADNKHNFTFTLAKYQEDLYNYGRALPSFQNNMTVPDRSNEDYYALSENATQRDLQRDVNNSQNTMIAKLAEIYSSHIVTLYKISETAITETGIQSNLIYNFAEDTITWENPSLANGWSVEVPEDLTNVWVTSGTAHGKSRTDTIYPNEWARPIKTGQNGTNGVNTFTIELYKRSSAKPIILPETLIYRFDNASMACTNWNGWRNTIPEANDDNDPCWEIHATALSTENYATINTADWSEPVKIFTEGYSKQEILDLIGDQINETPNVLASPTTAIFAVDEDGIITVPQTSYLDVRVVQNGEDIPFTYGQIVLPEGVSISSFGSRLIFTVAQGVRLKNTIIRVPVNFIKFTANDILIDENDNPLVWVADEDGKWYGDCAQVQDLPIADEGGFIYWNSEEDVTSTEEIVKGGVFHSDTFYTYNGTLWQESDIVPLGIETQSEIVDTYMIDYVVSTISGGRYLGPYDNTENFPDDLVIGDYFTWVGANETPYVGSNFSKLQTGCVYKWNGTQWEKDTSGRHLGNALTDILQVAGAEVAANNSDVTEMVKKMIAWDIVTQNIKVSGSAIINSTITAELTIGGQNGFIQSSNFTEQGDAGFKLKSDGSAVFRQLKVGTGAGYSLLTADGKINTDLINVNSLFAGNITLTGSITSSTAGWQINADGTATFNKATIGGNTTIQGVCNVDKLHFARTYSPSDTGFINGDVWVVSV